jgi:Uncharacterized Fe-S protein
MAYRSTPISEDIIWRAPLFDAVPTLAASLRDKVAEHRPHLLDFMRLNETPPLRAMTLAEWSRQGEFTSLLALYSDHIYRNQPGQTRENKPLLSLWAQWYIGLQVPSLMLALLTETRALDLSPEHFLRRVS